MTIKVISRKIREPVLPYLHIQRSKINDDIDTSIKQKKKCIYLSGFASYGKTVAVASYLQEPSPKYACWYSLDEWDRDPVTFLSYLYNIFLKKGLISEEIADLFSQPLNTEKHIKNFIGLMADELENNLTERVFLVLDNFQEVQNEPLIENVIISLLNYCPEDLKIIIISQQNLPQSFYPYYIKHELTDIKLKDLLLTENEAKNLLKLLDKENIDFSNDLFYISQKSISLFILLAQNFQDKNSLEKHYENIMFKNALDQTTNQILSSLNNETISFIHQTLFLPKIKTNILQQLFNDDCKYKLDNLIDNGVINYSSEDEEYSYNSSFIPVLQEHFFDLPEADKELHLGKIIGLIQDEISEGFLTVLIRAKLYGKIIEYLKSNYEYYFRNYLYETLEQLISSLLEIYPQNSFLIYLQIRLYRSTGRMNQVITIYRNMDNSQYTPEIALEEGICEAMIGHFKISIEKLTHLEKSDKLKINDYLSLINCLGISYQQIHQLDIALEYFLKAINLKSELIYQYDLIKSYHNLGLTYTWLGDFEKAISAYEQSLYLAKQLKVMPLSITYNNLAIIQNLQGDFDKAYHNCLEGLEQANKVNNNLDKIHINLTLTEAYRGLKNLYKVQDCMSILEQLLNTNPNPILDALLLRQKARIALDENQIDLAREFIFKAINIRKLTDGDPAFLEYKLELAKICYYAKEYQEAINNLEFVEPGIKHEKHFYHLTRVYIYKALSYFHLKDNKNFEIYYDMAFQLINEKNYRQLALKLNKEYQKKEDKVNVKETTQINIKLLLEEPLKISTFGQLVVSKGEKKISKADWHGKKTKLLFAYILLNKNGINKDNIFQALFPEGEQSRTSLHVMVNRLRKALASVYNETDIIQFSEDLYRFNSSINYEWDASRMEYLINEAKQLADPVDKYQKIAEALKVYTGHFMSGYELESWVFSTQEYYRNLAYKNFNDLSNYYFSQKQFEKLLKLSDHFFNIDNCYEEACKFKMKALMSLKRKNDALQQYLILEKNLEKVFNDKPSLEIQKFKEELFNSPEQLEGNTSSDLILKNAQLQNEINERKKAMEELQQIQTHLIQSEKMSGLNTLVAGVAHEINNPTNFVNGIAHNLLGDINDLKKFIFELAGDEADQKFVEMFSKHFEKIENSLGDINQGSERIKTIVQDLRTFSRLDEAEQKRIDIIESIMSTLRLIKSQYSQSVEFITDFQEKRMIECYPAQLNQAFMNIIINSCQAIQIKQDKTGYETLGKLIIKTFLQKDNSGKEEFLGIEFKDNGIGMPENIKNKIFDPFFTTKDVGEGKGMGLSITYSIIEKHQGTIDVKSEPGVGTSFTLYLPLNIKNTTH